jgi:hypothetical protein
VAKAAAESVYSGVGVRRGVAKVSHKWGNFVLCWCGWQTVGSAPDENRFTVCEQARRLYYGTVFKAKKEILGNSEVKINRIKHWKPRQAGSFKHQTNRDFDERATKRHPTASTKPLARADRGIKKPAGRDEADMAGRSEDRSELA